MRLSAVQVSNHSRLQDLAIEVRDHLVLVGPNDSGKSSLLRCLDLALGASVAQLYARIGPADFRNLAEPFVIEAVLNDFTDDEKALFPDEIAVDVAAGTASLTIRLEALMDDNETLTVSRTGPTGGTGRQISRDQLRGIGWKMIGALSGERDLRDDRKTALDEILRVIDLGAERADFESIVQALESKLAGSAVLEGLRAQLAEQLSKALPDAVDKSDLVFVPGANADDDVLSDVRLQVKHGGSPRNLADQSDGMRALFAMALYDLVSASANVVGIDEPEIHLHPTSQRSLARLLRAGANQKIIATHSPDIVGVFPPESVVTVKPGGRLVQPEASFLTGDERMVLRWWVRDKLEPLTAARVVAVEGMSDRIIVERAAEVTGRELDRLGVCLVETSGSGDMGAIVKLFGASGFQVDLSLLIDLDAVADTEEQLGIDYIDFASHSVWVSNQDLEAEYVGALGSSQVWSAITTSGLFSKNQLANCAATGPGGARTIEDVAEFCRRKQYKVLCAMAVSSLISSSTAPKISSIENVLSEIKAP